MKESMRSQVSYGMGILGLLSICYGEIDKNFVLPARYEVLHKRTIDLSNEALRLTILSSPEASGRILNRVQENIISLNQIKRDTERDERLIGIGLVSMLPALVQLFRERSY